MKVEKYLSPRSMIVATGLILITFTLVPPTIYEYYINEPNLMFGNALLYATILGCLVFIWIGIEAGLRIPRLRVPRLAPIITVSAFAYLFLPSIVAIGLLLLTITIILSNEPLLLGLALLGQGHEVKYILKEAGQGAFNGSLPVALGIVWWSASTYLQLQDRLTHRRRLLTGSSVWVLALALALTATIMMARFILMPMLFGLFMIYLRHKIFKEKVGIGQIALRLALFISAVLMIFGLFSALRASSDDDNLLKSYIGYGPTSVNHFAALLAGQIDTTPLTQYFVQANFGFVYKFPFVIRISGSADILNEATAAIFYVTRIAGLNESYIWMTSFGEIISGIGILTPAYLMVFGFFLSRAWRSFMKEGIFGTLLYPWLAFGLLFSFGSNFVASNFLSILMLLTIMLWFYSSLVRAR